MRPRILGHQLLARAQQGLFLRRHAPCFFLLLIFSSLLSALSVVVSLRECLACCVQAHKRLRNAFKKHEPERSVRFCFFFGSLNGADFDCFGLMSLSRCRYSKYLADVAAGKTTIKTQGLQPHELIEVGAGSQL